jgi:sugar (glycoside-pentoside-hexuronide) transporter
MIIVVVCIAYVGQDLAYTLCDIPIWALPSVMHEDPKVKTNVITWANYGATIGAVLVTVLGIQVILTFGGERDPNAYFITAIIVSVIAAIAMMTTGLVTRERVKSTKKPAPFAENFKTIYKNKPLLIILLSIIGVGLTISVRAGIQFYYAVHVAEDPNFMTYAGLALVAGIFIGLGITPVLMKKFKKKTIFISTCIYSIILSLIPLFAGYHNVPFTIMMIGFGFVATGVFNNLIPNLLMDCIDYSEWKLGFRGEGIVFSARTFINKITSAMSRALVGFSLAFLGYIEGGVQSTYVINGLHMLMFLVPAILMVVSLVPMIFFSFTESKRDEILKILIDRRG